MRHRRHLTRTTIVVLLSAAVLLPTPAAAGDRSVAGTDRFRDAEVRLLKHVNRFRVRHGRRPLRRDKPTSHVARSRSLDMAGKRYFAHVEPDGDDAGRILDRRDISATEVMENIGQTYGLSLKQGSRRMARWWYRSAPHRAQMLARDINYIGLGIARRGSRYTYTAIFTRSRDKTDPRVVIDRTDWLSGTGGSRVTIEWHGVDPKLATGTAGIGRFETERFTVVAGWSRLDGDPRQSSRSLLASGRGDQVFRVRAVDNAGNVGPWAYAHVEAPDHHRPRVRVRQPRSL